MTEPERHIDARGANIENLAQVIAPNNAGSIGVPLSIGPGRTVIDIQSTAAEATTGKRDTNFVAIARSRNAGFVGREEELEKLRVAMSGDAGSATTALTQGFTGEGGIGKSQLAQRFAERACKALGGGKGDWDLFDCAWWVDGSAAGHALSIRELAETLGHAPQPTDTETDLRKGVRLLLDDGRRHLLVIDNLEAAATPEGGSAPGGKPWAALSELCLPPECRVLVTAREQHLPSSLAATITLDVLSVEDARVLLCRDRPKLARPEHAADLDAVTDHLGRLALAVDLARAWLQINVGDGPKALLAKLKVSDEATLGLFEDASLARHAKDYALSVASTLALHLDGLSGTPAEALLHAAAYAAADRIPEGLLAAVAGLEEDTGREGLAELASKSIVHREPSGIGGTLSIHRLTQAVARARLAGADTGANEQHLSSWMWYLIGLHSHSSAYEMFRARTASLPHAESVLTHASGEELVARLGAVVARLRHGIAPQYYQIGQLGAAAGHIDASIAWGEAQVVRDERILAVQYATRAEIKQLCGDLVGAEKDVQWSINYERGQTPCNERGLAILHASRASIRQQRDDLDGAEEDIGLSIHWFEAQSPRDQRSLAIRYSTRAGIRRERDDLAGAEEDVNRSISWCEAQSPRDEHGIAILLALRAVVRQDRGDLIGAEQDIEQTIRWDEAQTPRDERGLAIDYATRANIRRAQRRFAEARADIDAALEWFEGHLPSDKRSIADMKQTRTRIDAEEAGVGNRSGGGA